LGRDSQYLYALFNVPVAVHLSWCSAFLKGLSLSGNSHHIPAQALIISCLGVPNDWQSYFFSVI
jgi:hypothetical protein